MALTIQLHAQDTQKKLGFHFGMGSSLLGTGDITTFNVENEFSYKLNSYFSTSFTFNYGRGNMGKEKLSAYAQGNLNIFISPFKNNRKNDFKIGTGVSLMDIYSINHHLAMCGTGLEEAPPYEFNKRTPFGFNIIIEDTYSINDTYIVGIKLFTQSYTSDDINSGILVKVGLKL